ncbi:MAG: cytochrome c3 family protein [Methanococcaceae archaeon]
MRFLFALFLAGLCSISLAQSSQSKCFECHGDQSLTMERNGKNVSLFVSQDNFKKSVHADAECTDCHAGFDAENLPHKEGKDIAKVDCAQCHDTKTFSKSIHGQKKIECFQCHTKHEIQPAAALKKSEADLCIKCHNASDVASYKKSIHYQKFIAGQKAPVCADCHDKSAHNIQKANFSKPQEEKICSACHQSSDTQFAKSVHSMSKHGSNTPGCVSCHGAHQIFNNKYSISSQSCIKCHLDKKKFVAAGKPNLVSFVENYKTSIHSRIGKNNQESASCVDCHGNHEIMGAEASKSMTARQNIPNTCGKCHADILKEYNKSSHGTSFAKGVAVAPVCTDCHGEHTIKPIKDSPFGKIAEKDVCYNCHVNNPEVIKLTGRPSSDVMKYEKSAHFIALKNGNAKAPVCSDCHGGHSMKAAGFSDANTNRMNVAQSCGKGSDCHSGITAQFNESIHGQAVKSGVKDAPTCVSCHGNHQVVSSNDPTSSTAQGKQVVKLCSSCHSNVELNNKYDLPGAKASSYMESYHGLAVTGGSKFAADCASCHGAHNIKPSSDPTSSINEANLSATCGKCHPGANLKAQFKQVHLSGQKEESVLLYWITIGYYLMIGLVIGGMLVHNVLDFVRKRQEKKHHKKEIEELKKQGKYYLRMSLHERVQHFIMLTSFISLVISGFGFKYPNSWWVTAIRYVIGPRAFELRSLSHRIFGIIMIAISLYHLYYLLFTKRGRKLLLDFLPKLQDLKDVIINVKYLLGVSKEKPRFDRFSYMEKAEYWALVWGVIVMSFTGLMLMFNTFFLSIAPKILLDAATLVHLYEAWLATLAIIVWHFYYVIFNPEVYPLNTAFIKGTLSEHEMENEHPVELERIRNTEELNNEK